MYSGQNIDDCGKKKNFKENFIEKQFLNAKELMHNKSRDRS
jgi:hypothetical protein